MDSRAIIALAFVSGIVVSLLLDRNTRIGVRDPLNYDMDPTPAPPDNSSSLTPDAKSSGLVQGRIGTPGSSSTPPPTNKSSPPTVAHSYIPGHMPWKGNNLHLAPCVRASGPGLKDTTAGVVTHVDLVLDLVCMSYMLCPLSPHYARRPQGAPNCDERSLEVMRQQLNTTDTVRDQIYTARLVGPAIVTPRSIRKVGRWHYRVEYMVPDPGDYALDIALEYSNVTNHPSLFSYLRQRVMYEGNAIPRSPFAVTVRSPPSGTMANPNGAACLGDQGRWVLRNGTEYTSATWAWQPLGCSVDLASVVSVGNLQKCFGNKTTVLMVGDSNMRLQHAWLTADIGKDVPNLTLQLRHIDNTWLPTERQDRASERKQEVEWQSIETQLRTTISKAKAYPKTPTVVVVNYGLHHIIELGHHHYGVPGMSYEGWEERFVKLVRRMAEATREANESHIAVAFRSTTASWHKWGNSWFDFVNHPEQPLFHLNPHTVETFNNMTARVLANYTHMSFLDTHPITAGRGDNTEHEPKWSSAMVHYSRQTYTAMNQRLMLFAMHRVGCPDLVNTLLSP